MQEDEMMYNTIRYKSYLVYASYKKIKLSTGVLQSSILTIYSRITKHRPQNLTHKI